MDKNYERGMENVQEETGNDYKQSKNDHKHMNNH